MGQIKFITGLVMTAVFSIILVSMALQFSSDNNTVVSLNNDSDYSTMISTLKSNLSSFQDDSGTSFDDLSKTSAESGNEVAEGGGQFKVGVTGSFGTAKTIMLNSYRKIFGQDNTYSFIFNTMFAVFIWIIGLYIYKTWFGRNPD